MSRPRLLVIDDDRLTRQLLARTLDREGFEVMESANGREAFQMLESARPALLVSDYEMPEFTGAQLCEIVRKHQDPELAETPIILLTAHAGEEHEVECLSAGANDFVSKPVNAAILKARIETHLRLHALRAQLQQQNAELEEWRRSRELDLEAAQITQQAILPARAPSVPGWEAAAHYQPVIHVGGDMYHWQRMPDGGWLFWIADATGHGASAALITTLTTLVFRHAIGEGSATPAGVLRAANAEFYSILRGKSFMTAACLLLEPEAGKISFAGAGHPPLLVRRAGGEITLLPSAGPPIGVLPELDTPDAGAELAPGDVALLYTDGLYSGRTPDGERMTPQDLAGLLPSEFVSAEDFLHQTINALTARAAGSALEDDVSAVALRRV